MKSEVGKEGAAETGVKRGLEPPKFQRFSSQCALHGLCTLDSWGLTAPGVQKVQEESIMSRQGGHLNSFLTLYLTLF